MLFLMHVVLARAIGPADYGTFSYALTIAAVLAIVAPLGWPTALMRFIAQYKEQQQWSLLRGAVQRAYQITFVCAVLTALVLWGVSYLGSLSNELSTSLRFAALILPFLSFVGLRRKALLGLQKVKASIIPEEILLPTLVIVALYLFAVTSASGALLAYVGAALLAFLLGSTLLWRSIPLQGRIAKPVFQTRSWMLVALPMVFGGLGQIIMNRTDVLMLGAMLDMQVVGVYSAAVRIAVLNTMVFGAINTIAAPMMAAAFHAGRSQELRGIMRKAMIWSTLGALPAFAVMIISPQFLLGFFGTEFTGAGNLLRILAFGQFVNAATGPAGFALLMTGREQAFAWTMGIVAAANVVGNLIAIPIYGAVGAAVVTAVAVAVLNLFLLFLVWRRNNSTGAVS